MLSDEIHTKITTLCASADAYVEGKKFELAMRLYQEAWDLLPEPRHDWDAATWILSALGDCCYLSGDYARSVALFTECLRCPNALANPFIHLRLGESHFELGNETSAADELTRAYMGAGKEIFADEAPKYFELLKRVLKLPPGQTEL